MCSEAVNKLKFCMGCLEGMGFTSGLPHSCWHTGTRLGRVYIFASCGMKRLNWLQFYKLRCRINVYDDNNTIPILILK